jgi:predicted dehydrogenase
MAVSLEQHDRLLKSEADRTPGQGNGGCMVVPYFPMRFDPLSQRVRAMLTGGKLGKVDVVRLRLGSNQAATPGFSKSWFANAEVSGGGVFMDHGIHAVDFLHWLLGEPLDVVAQVGSSLLNLPVEDSIIAVYRFPRNVIAEVACSWVWHAATNTVEAYGEAGTLLVQGNDPASRDFTHDEFGRIYCNDFQERRWQSVETKSTFRSEEFHSRAVKAFVEFVQGRAPLPMGMRECRAALAMVLGAYESARQGRRMVFTTGGSSAAGGAMGFRPE